MHVDDGPFIAKR